MTDFANISTKVFLSENLRALRKRLNMSQEELAEKIGLNRGNIASYEAGSAEPKICNLVKLANLFKVSVFDLIHHHLQEEDNFLQAQHRHQNGSPVAALHAMEHYAKEAEDFDKAIQGLQCLFRLKLKNAGSLPPEMQFLTEQFEQLYSVTSHLLDSHIELITLIKEKCSEKAVNAEAGAYNA